MGPGTPYFREIQVGGNVSIWPEQKIRLCLSSSGGPPKNNIDVSFVTFFLGSVSVFLL